MVVSKPEFNQALQEINKSYSKLVERIEKLEELVIAARKEEKTATRTVKRDA